MDEHITDTASKLDENFARMKAILESIDYQKIDFRPKEKQQGDEATTAESSRGMKTYSEWLAENQEVGHDSIADDFTDMARDLGEELEKMKAILASIRRGLEEGNWGTDEEFTKGKEPAVDDEPSSPTEQYKGGMFRTGRTYATSEPKSGMLIDRARPHSGVWVVSGTAAPPPSLASAQESPPPPPPPPPSPPPPPPPRRSAAAAASSASSSSAAAAAVAAPQQPSLRERVRRAEKMISKTLTSLETSQGNDRNALLSGLIDTFYALDAMADEAPALREQTRGVLRDALFSTLEQLDPDSIEVIHRIEYNEGAQQ